MLQSLDDQIVFAPRWPASPFPGLRPFRITATEDESLIFYGRNRAKDEILARLNSSHLVFVVGPSGFGKSSLLKVGVIKRGFSRTPERTGEPPRWCCAIRRSETSFHGLPDRTTGWSRKNWSRTSSKILRPTSAIIPIICY